MLPPKGCSRDAEYTFDMHLVNWVNKDNARIASDAGDVYKISIAEADSWETPRPPFEACTHAFLAVVSRVVIASACMLRVARV